MQNYTILLQSLQIRERSLGGGAPCVSQTAPLLIVGRSPQDCLSQ